jgi:protein gp37
MARLSRIEWTDATWNPWQGCHKVSPGCAHCYMYRDKTRYGQEPSLVVRSKTTFELPLTWKEPKLIFTCSWSDFFIQDADGWRAAAWDVIRSTPQHTYQILTKRPDRVSECLPKDWPLPNVWLGTSVENPRFYHRITTLHKIPAVVRFLSLEPLLASMPDLPLGGISWVIVGGESGPRSRPMQSEWVCDIRDQCRSAKVYFFFKQWGGLRKHANGRKLEGRFWDQMPRRTGVRDTRTKRLGRVAHPSRPFQSMLR